MKLRRLVSAVLGAALLATWAGLCAAPQAQCAGRACCLHAGKAAPSSAAKSCSVPCTLSQKLAYAILGLGADPARLFVQALALPAESLLSAPHKVFQSLTVFLEPSFSLYLAHSPPGERAPPA